MVNNHKSALGIDETTTALLGYLIPFLALLLIFIERKNKFVRLHARQSVLFVAASLSISAAYLILSAIMLAAVVISNSNFLGYVNYLNTLVFPPLLVLAWFAVLMFAAYGAYNGETRKLPVIGNLAEKWSN